MTLKTSICARYKNAEGWHVFQSDDLPGLYVASRDPEKAFNDVGPSIELLLRLNEGIECSVAPETSFREFLATVKHRSEEADDALIMSDRRFLVSAQAEACA